MNEVFYIIIVTFMGGIHASDLDFVSTQEYETLEQCEVVAARVLKQFTGKRVYHEGETFSIKNTRCVFRLSLKGL